MTRRAAVLVLLVAGACGDAGSPDAGSSVDRSAADQPERDLVIPTLVDIAGANGLTFRHTNGAAGDKWMPETVGSGGGFLDFDLDGRLDVFLVNGRAWAGGGQARSRLYRGLGDGRFEDVSRSSGADVELYGMGAAFGDYDDDGDPDIYVTAVGRNVLLRNDEGRFRDVTDRMRVGGDPAGRRDAWSTAATWLDYDRDGRLDLFVCNYVRWTPETDLFHTLDGVTKAYATPQLYEGETCVMYRNEGPDSPFRDVTREAGLWNPEGKSLGIRVDDFDDDGWPDIFVTNDTQPNFLYVNQGDGTFDEVGVRAGVGFDPTGRARAGMGVDVTDLDGDGRLSVGIGNFSGEAVSVYTQQDADLFRDRAPALGLARPTHVPLTFGLRFVDLNLDGRDDLILANGHIEPSVAEVRQDITFEQPAQLFLRAGDGFVDVTEQAGDGLTRPAVGRGLATGDIDGDGDPDVLFTVNAGPARLLRNDLPSEPPRLHVRFDRPAIGALVRLHADSTTQRWYVTGSGSYLTQSDTRTHTFGLGAATADSVSVRWPDGSTSVVRDGLEAGQVVDLAWGNR